MQASNSCGIYTLANDNVLDWLIACLESIRAHGCTLPVTVIAFDDKTTKLERFAQEFGFELWHDPDFAELDALGDLYNPNSVVGAHMFRKFAAFWGRYDCFLYVDSDTVALMNFDELLVEFCRADLEWMFFDVDPDYVFRSNESMLQTLGGTLDKTFSCGAFFARRGLLDRMELHELAQRGLALQEQFVPYTGDQSFLNYCVAAKRWRNAQAAHVIPELWSFTWAGSTFMRQHDIFVEAFRTGTFRSKRFPFIHWAGFEPNPNIPNQNVYYSFRIRHGSSFEKLRFALRWRYKRWRTRGAAKIRAKVAPK